MQQPSAALVGYADSEKLDHGLMMARAALPNDDELVKFVRRLVRRRRRVLRSRDGVA